MSTTPADSRNPLLVPLVAVGILAVVVVLFVVLRGGDDEPAAKPAPTKATAAAPASTATDKLSGSGDAPAAITVKAATAARSATGFGLAADIPDIDVEKFDTVTLVLGQDGGDTLWNLRTFRDSRGAFVTPELYLVKSGEDEQFACAGSAIRIKSTRLTATVPLACLDNPTKPLQALLEITTRDGGEEKTSISKVLSAPKA